MNIKKNKPAFVCVRFGVFICDWRLNRQRASHARFTARLPGRALPSRGPTRKKEEKIGMPMQGSNKRQRSKIISIRLLPGEADALEIKADQAGHTVGGI